MSIRLPFVICLGAVAVTALAQPLDPLTQGSWDGSAQGNARLAFAARGDELVGATDSGGATWVVVRRDGDGVLRGAWSELPTRQPPHAGRVEFRVAGDRLDGRFDRGPGTAWDERWDVVHVGQRAVSLQGALMTALQGAPRLGGASKYGAPPKYGPPPLGNAPSPAPKATAQQCTIRCDELAGAKHCHTALTPCVERSKKTTDPKLAEETCFEMFFGCVKFTGVEKKDTEAWNARCMAGTL